METAQLILEIFWMVWIPWMILFFGSMALVHFGYPKLHHFILKYLYYFSKEDRDVYSLNEQEIDYVWVKYKKGLTTLINKKELV
jgi:hypothetical protein